MTEAFQVLPFDSELFGFPVARLEPGADPAVSIEALRARRIRLAYAFAPWEDGEMRARLEAAGAALVDHKIRFRKELRDLPAEPTGVEAWKGSDCAPELEALALASGHQSRFFTDPRVPRHVFPELYLAWIRRSVSHEIADEVLVIQEGGAPVGLVTLAVKAGLAEIGLVAVHESQRGKGLGRRLMAAAERAAAALDASALEVVTQGANTGACALYTASGYAVAREEAVYHLWMEPVP